MGANLDHGINGYSRSSKIRRQCVDKDCLLYQFYCNHAQLENHI